MSKLSLLSYLVFSIIIFIIIQFIYYCIKKNVFNHLKTIFIHKWWVFVYCCKCGLIWRGIKHDLSKFSPTEFLESIKYYTGTRSPIDVCKEKNGYSKAWQHHKGRNSHHYEYWTDNYDNGTSYIQMPLKDAIEMVCDYLAAARAYMGKDFSYKSEYEWWINKKEPTANSMHPTIKKFITDVLYKLYRFEHSWKFNRKNLIEIYEQAVLIVSINKRNGMEVNNMFKWRCPKCNNLIWNSWKCPQCEYKHENYKGE